MLSLSDAEIAVRYLNAATGKPRERILRLLEMLREFERVRTEMNQANEAYANLQFGKGVPERELLAAAHAYEDSIKKADRLHSAINEALRHYLFRPLVTYTLVDDAWRGGLIPHDNRRWFHVKLGEGCIIGEPDVAMSLVRLQLTGDLEKVRLCEMCRQRWRVAAKRNYKFCSAECLKKSSTSAPDYLDRKAANQRRYRKNLRLKHAAEDAARAKRS